VLPTIPVEIDIVPGSAENPVYPLSRLLIPVALLGSDSFDVTDADAATLSFGPNGAAPAFDLTNPLVFWLSHWDVNADGHRDLLAHFRTEETGIAVGEATACLTGQTRDLIPIEGCDGITTLVDCGDGFESALAVPPVLWLVRRRRRRRVHPSPRVRDQ
jgi:hypothetical protein